MLPSSVASITALFTVAVLGHVSQVTAVQEDPTAVRTSGQPEIRRWVNATALNFRRGSGADHSVIRVLAANEPVRVLGQAGQWVQVEWDSGKGPPIQGWVFGRFLSETPLTQKEIARLRRRSRAKDPGTELALLCVVALPTIYLIRRVLSPARGRGETPSGEMSRRSRRRDLRNFDRQRAFDARETAVDVSDGPTITGKAWVVDGDGIEVAGKKIRLARLDAPEIGQTAKDRDGLEFDHGWRSKNALIREIGGKHVRVTVLGHDKYGRVLGIVTCNGKDVNAWLVRNGYAIAAYGDRYKKEELEARKAKCGMWGYKEKTDPRLHRRRASGGRPFN